jgi:hypothetical protein
MKKVVQALALASLLAAAGAARATPSTTFWTPATTYVQPYLVPHLTYDTYFGETGAYPIDAGLTIGFLPFEKLQGELGFDLNYPGYTKSGFLLAAKLGVPEGSFGEWSPGVSAGIYGVGFETDATKVRSDYNILHAEVGKSFGKLGTLTVGGYLGNDEILLDETGAKAASGFMAAWLSPDWNVGLPGLAKLNFFADVQTGKSFLGAWGAGVGLYFTPAIDVLMGPVFFLNDKVQPGTSKMLWTLQLDVDIELLAKPKT